MNKIGNHKILTEFWNSNTPKGSMAFLEKSGFFIKDLDAVCSALIIAEYLEDKKIYAYLGIGLGKNSKDDIEHILKWGKKIPLDLLTEKLGVKNEK
jgi:hypothetical protein